MRLILRRFVAVLAAVGFLVSCGAYILSFFGFTLRSGAKAGDDISVWLLLLLCGVVPLYLLLLLVEGGLGGPSFTERWKFRPRWTVRVWQTLGSLAMAHFVLFLVLSHASSPGLVNGQFVLDTKADVHTVITETHYRSLLAWETRFFAS